MTTHTFQDADIQQGADYIPPALKRSTYPYPVRAAGCTLINTCTGLPVNPDDATGEDFTGATATMTLRENDASGAIVLTIGTATGEIVLNDGTIHRKLTAAQTALFPLKQIYGQLDIHWPDGRIERQYIITAGVIKGAN